MYKEVNMAKKKNWVQEKKKVLEHLKDDARLFEKEEEEDETLIKFLKKKKKKKGKK